MNDAKIFISLQHLNIYELASFEKFVESPYFNVNEALKKLYSIFLPYLRDNKEIELDKYEVWDMIFVEEEFDDKRFRKLTSDLTKLFERWLAQQIYDENNIVQANNLLEHITRKSILRMYNSALANAERLLERNFNRDADYYYQVFALEQKKFNFTSEFEKKSKKQIKHNWLNIKDISDNLDVFYLSEKMKLYTTLMSIKSVMKIDIDLRFTENIVRFIKNTDYKKYPPLAIYYQIYLTLKESENLNHYYELKEMIKNSIHYFSFDEAQDIYEASINYCIKKANSGLSEFYSELLFIYKEMINKGIFEIEESLDPTKFRNIVHAALRANDFKWVEWFIETYNKKINLKYRENAISFNLARLYFYKKDFIKVKEHLRDVEFNDMTYELSSKSMLIATYYDTEDFDPLYSLLDSFNTFLNRNKKTIPEHRLKIFKQLIKFIRKLMTINVNDKIAVEKLRNEIDQAGDIPDRQWLLDRVNELRR